MAVIAGMRARLAGRVGAGGTAKAVLPLWIRE